MLIILEDDNLPLLSFTIFVQGMEACVMDLIRDSSHPEEVC